MPWGVDGHEVDLDSLWKVLLMQEDSHGVTVVTVGKNCRQATRGVHVLHDRGFDTKPVRQRPQQTIHHVRPRPSRQLHAHASHTMARYVVRSG